MTTEEPLEKHDGGGPVDVPPSAPPMSAPAPDADDDQDGPCTTSSDTKTAPSPGPRAARLRELFTQSLRHTLAKIASWDQFSRCYPTMAVAADGLLRQVQAQMVEKLSDKCEVRNGRVPPPFSRHKELTRLLHPSASLTTSWLLGMSSPSSIGWKTSLPTPLNGETRPPGRSQPRKAPISSSPPSSS